MKLVYAVLRGWHTMAGWRLHRGRGTGRLPRFMPPQDAVSAGYLTRCRRQWLSHTEYLSYMVRHKWWVLVAGLRVGAPLWRLLIHDWTKFLPSEWFPYVRWFDQRRTTLLSQIVEQRKLAFDYAHHMHVRRNRHHWNYWVLVEESCVRGRYYRAMEMPIGLVREMVADWMGAGRTINGRWTIEEWWSMHHDAVCLHPNTRMLVERLLAEQIGVLKCCITSPTTSIPG